MGLVTNLPVIVGPSLGLNVYFREIADKCPENKDGTIDGIPCKEWGVTTLPWTDALGAVYISGWLYLALTFTGFRGYLLDAFPKFFRSAIAAGVGFFLIYEGLKIGQITRVTIEKDYLAEAIDYGRCSSSGVCTSPVDLHNRWYNIGVAHLDQVPAARIAIFGFILASGFELFNIKGSFIYAIWIATFVGISYYHCRSTSNYDDDYINECVTDLSIWGGRPEKIPFLVDWSKNPAGELTFKYAKKPLFWKVVWTFLFFQIFDSYGAMEAIISRMKITEKYPTVTADRINRAMAVDGLSVWIGAIMGCNNCNIYAESLTAIEVGSRTGLSAIITGSCLLLCLLFVYPFVYVIPKPAVSSVLILVGIYTMAGEIWKIDTKDFIHRATSLITIATMGFTYSITNGISAGMIFYCWLEITALVMKKVGIDVEVIRPGTKPEVPHPFMILMAVFAAVRFATLGQS
jgi:AGZA family xanthine/uracil permease-like MFS transporter